MISIIGSGRVGSALGFHICTNSLDNVTLINRTKNKAVGRALDITNAISDNSSVTINGTDDFELMKGSKVIVIVASKQDIVAEKSDVLFQNVSMIKEICPQIKKYSDDARIVVVTNPLDIITYYTIKETGFSPERIIGMGSGLDSARFRYLLSLAIGTSQSNIEGMVIGEHGPSFVPLFSNAKSEGNPVLEILDENKIGQIKIDLKDYANRLRRFKTVSTFGAAKRVFDIIKAILNDERSIIPASVFLQGEYDLSDISIGVPITIGRNGVEKIHEINIDKSELDLFHKSAGEVKNNINKICN